MKQEKAMHKATQKLRSSYYHYINNNIEDVGKFEKQQKIKDYALMINNKLVDVLILNELIHKEVNSQTF